MLVRGTKRLVAVVGVLIVLTVTVVILMSMNGGQLTTLQWSSAKWQNRTDSLLSKFGMQGQDRLETGEPKSSYGDHDAGTLAGQDVDMANTHRVLRSVSTADQKYFPIVFGEQQAINPSIIPHPSINNTWIIVAQQQRSTVQNSVWFVELVCDAVFTKGALACIQPPQILPIAATASDLCVGDLSFFALNIGPHDARVFYGPESPYTIYGSNSAHNCFGQWISDFRMLVDWGYETPAANAYRHPTDLQRPAPYSPVEKNWFVFWDTDDQMYLHYDVAPRRAFAKLELDGSVSADLAPFAAVQDESCMARYMPHVAEQLESTHQATNSLSITLCQRSDPLCIPTDQNTFIFTIFQHKSFYSYHSVYEPYVMFFQRTPPFEIYAISSKPLWIYGRGTPGQGKQPDGISPEQAKAWDQTEMCYVTSMSWKTQGQKYHGYSDDVLFIGFGIEDDSTAGIDIAVSDLLLDLGLCAGL